MKIGNKKQWVETYGKRIGLAVKEYSLYALIEKRKKAFGYIYAGTLKSNWIKQYKELSEQLIELTKTKQINLKNIAVEFNYLYDKNFSTEFIYMLLGYCLVKQKLIPVRFKGEPIKNRFFLSYQEAYYIRSDKYELKRQKIKSNKQKNNKYNKKKFQKQRDEKKQLNKPKPLSEILKEMTK